jgi:hypothetical protein
MTPKKLLLRAAILSAAYLLLHLLGGRNYAGFLSGTPVGGLGAVFLGSAYVVMHFAFVIVAPILVIAAGLLALSARLWPPSAPGPEKA